MEWTATREVTVHHQFAEQVHRDRLHTFEREAQLRRLAADTNGSARRRIRFAVPRRRARVAVEHRGLVRAHECR
jgi:hypothetical protein